MTHMIVRIRRLQTCKAVTVSKHMQIASKLTNKIKALCNLFSRTQLKHAFSNNHNYHMNRSRRSLAQILDPILHTSNSNQMHQNQCTTPREPGKRDNGLPAPQSQCQASKPTRAREHQIRER